MYAQLLFKTELAVGNVFFFPREKHPGCIRTIQEWGWKEAFSLPQSSLSNMMLAINSECFDRLCNFLCYMNVLNSKWDKSKEIEMCKYIAKISYSANTLSKKNTTQLQIYKQYIHVICARFPSVTSSYLFWAEKRQKVVQFGCLELLISVTLLSKDPPRFSWRTEDATKGRFYPNRTQLVLCFLIVGWGFGVSDWEGTHNVDTYLLSVFYFPPNYNNRFWFQPFCYELNRG